MEWIANRLREPTTWSGIVTLISMAGHVTMSDALAQAITTAGVALGGLASVILMERER